MNEKPNLDYIQKISGGDQAFEEKLLAVIRKEIVVEIDEYQENMKELLLDKASENIHKLKHKISILGLEKGYKIAVEFEEELKRGDFCHKEQFDEILKNILTFINES
ncbi:MAG: histidine kinase [Bacteroidetes bacterium GWB2_41_8]|nr:MAG: histidine kinase [Bacteroidetes bacterium GWB2_41_8]